MPGDDVALYICQLKIPLGIAQGKTGMPESMQIVRGVFIVPVIQEIVVQQRAPQQFPFPKRQNRSAKMCNSVAVISHSYAVKQTGCVAVLRECLHIAKLRLHKHSTHIPAKRTMIF